MQKLLSCETAARTAGREIPSLQDISTRTIAPVGREQAAVSVTAKTRFRRIALRLGRTPACKLDQASKKSKSKSVTGHRWSSRGHQLKRGAASRWAAASRRRRRLRVRRGCRPSRANVCLQQNRTAKPSEPMKIRWEVHFASCARTCDQRGVRPPR